MHGTFRAASPELHYITSARRSVFELPPPKPVTPEGFLVRERDGDQEDDQDKGDRISIETFPIDVKKHRTALLFAEVTAQTIDLGCRRSNGLSGMLKAQQHGGCAARVHRIRISRNDQP
jgi:hypothetical protein